MIGSAKIRAATNHRNVTLPLRHRCVYFVGLTLLVSPLLLAQERAEPKYPRLDLTPLVGYRTSMSFRIEPHVRGTDPRVVFDASPTFGLGMGMRINEADLIEFRWARQHSDTHVEDAGVTSSRQPVTLDEFHGDFTHEYVPDNWPAWAKPFVIGSVGATHVSGGANTSFTRFSFGLGGGVKLFAGKHVGVRIQAEWLPIVVDPHAAFVCGAGCIVRIGGTVSSQGEVTIGPILRF